MKSLKYIVILLLLLENLSYIFSQTVNIKITNIRNTKGKIQLNFYKSSESFEKDIPCLQKKYTKELQGQGELTVTIDLNPGTWGIALLDDENNDGNMEYNVMGMPKEGFGFSDYFHKGLNRPTFDDFCFKLENGTKYVEIVVKYM